MSISPTPTPNAQIHKVAKPGLAKYVNAKTMLIVVAILVVGYMAWPMVFPSKKESATTTVVADKPSSGNDEIHAVDTEGIEAVDMSTAAVA